MDVIDKAPQLPQASHKRRGQGSRDRTRMKQLQFSQEVSVRKFSRTLDVFSSNRPISAVEKRALRSMYCKHIRATPYSVNEMHILRELSRKFPAQPAVPPVSQPRLVGKVKIQENQREDQALATTPTDTQPDTQNIVDNVADGGVA